MANFTAGLSSPAPPMTTEQELAALRHKIDQFVDNWVRPAVTDANRRAGAAASEAMETSSGLTWRNPFTTVGLAVLSGFLLVSVLRR
jgi:ElaB/YqjD/DUF883 family membrane-anchored ribosome-binding protein